MAGESGKWMILVATIWIQAFTGTIFDFSVYSTELKSVLGISQVQLNYLTVAADLAKFLAWSSGWALMYFPLWVVLFMAAFMGLIGYGLQWLIIINFITLPYLLVFLLCFLAGLSMCWFNTVCFVLCIQNFTANRSLAISLTASYNGVSAALFALAGNAIDPSSSAIYLLLNALLPLLTSITALLPILRQPSLDPHPSNEVQRRESIIFLLFMFLAILTGVYLLLFGTNSSDVTAARLLVSGAIFLLIFPLFIPGVVSARDWFHRKIHSRFSLEGSASIRVKVDDDLQLHQKLLTSETSNQGDGIDYVSSDNGSTKTGGKDDLAMLGEEHSAWLLVRRLEFWLYYIAYFCGGTISLVYSNNLGQIAQSLGQSSNTTTLVTLFASFSFFGRLLSAVPDYMREKVYFARTGWMTIAFVPTPVALFLLAASGNPMALQAGTALIGLSSGFIFVATVSITSELFGPNSIGVNHNILITNIPIGSFIYGYLAAFVYDANVSSAPGDHAMTESVVCMGRQCYYSTFLLWGCISLLGLASAFLLFLRTRQAYNHFERNRISSTRTVLG